MKKVLLITCILAIGVAGFFIYNKRPAVIIWWDAKNKKGKVKMGNKTSDFDDVMGVVTSTWNGYKMSISSDGFQFTRNGKTIESSGPLTPYMGGSTYIQIIQT